MAHHAAVEFCLALPAGYRRQEVLAFHARDPESVAEQTGPGWLRKGMLLRGVPTMIEITLRETDAHCCAWADSTLAPDGESTVREIAQRLLGLVLDPEPFEAAVQNDAILGPLVRAQTGLRIPQTATPFEALTWAITGQQIHLAFAITLRRTLIRLAGVQHSRTGLWCYPEAASVARLEPEQLGQQKFSRAKAETLVRVSQRIEQGTLPISDEAALLAVKGIGPWTVQYTRLRGLADPDCSLHGDAAVRTALQRRLGREAKPSISEAEQLLATYRPYRSLAAAHLWASLAIPS